MEIQAAAQIVAATIRRQAKASKNKCYPSDRIFDGDVGQRQFFEALDIVIGALAEN